MKKRIHLQDGFTLIEALVIVLVVVILAGIAMSQFASYRASARDAQALADLRGLATAQTAFFASRGEYAVAASQLPEFEPSLGVTVTIVRADTFGFRATAFHRDGTESYAWNSEDGLEDMS